MQIIRTGDPGIDRAAQSVRERREKLRAAEEELATDTSALVLTLRARFAVRVVAALVGISPARVSQIEQNNRPE